MWSRWITAEGAWGFSPTNTRSPFGTVMAGRVMASSRARRLRMGRGAPELTKPKDMTDKVNPEQRSRMMAAVSGSNTSPELYVRKRLFAAGFRYRLHVNELPGKPDIVLPRFRFAVFVHGCFWHGHSCSRGKRPASNVEFWNAKLDGNVRRDRKNKLALKAHGWSPIVIWECRLKIGTEALLTHLKLLDDSSGR